MALDPHEQRRQGRHDGALKLLEQKHQIRVIEHRSSVLARLHRELPTEVIFEGDATDVEVLDQAGIRKADVVAACLASDEENLMICYTARQHFHTPHHWPHQ